MQAKLLRGYLERNCVKAGCSDGEVLPGRREKLNIIKKCAGNKYTHSSLGETDVLYNTWTRLHPRK